VTLQELKETDETVTVEVPTRGLLFDMDGVLISSIGSVIRCWRRWCAHYNIPNADTYEIPHGHRAIEIVRLLRPDIDEEEGLRLIEDLELEDTADLRVLPGVRELLESLPAERWAIVTSATRRLLLGRLEVAGLPVPERVVTAESVIHGKPAPDPYLMGAAMLGLQPADCIVLEDAPAGVSAGVAAGCRVLGVIGTHSAEELSGTTWITPSLETVRATVEEHQLRLRFSALR